MSAVISGLPSYPVAAPNGSVVKALDRPSGYPRHQPQRIRHRLSRHFTRSQQSAACGKEGGGRIIEVITTALY